MNYLYDKLKEYGESDAYPFHMPGHKRRMEGVNPYILDITEIDGFDNLHHAEGILKEAMERAAGLYGSEETHYLINGSTGGILAAVSACTSMHGKLLMARNCHKAAYHSAQIRGLETVYVYPGQVPLGVAGGICPKDVEEILEKEKDIQAVLITSPTYEGIVSDVKTIGEIAHRYQVPLIVDEAHGAHFGFHPYFPESSVRLGADIVIHSLHKTLPSMTQTALLHVNGSLVDRNKLREYLGIYQTSSPSYVLMAGMDQCVRLLEKEGTRMFEAFAARLSGFRKEAERLRFVRVEHVEGAGGAEGSNDREESGIFAADPSKIMITVPGRSGQWIARTLRNRYHLELEMETAGYALALTSVADTGEGFERLLRALKEMDEELGEEREKEPFKRAEKERSRWENEEIRGETDEKFPAVTIARAKELPGERISLKSSAGRISKEYAYLYPPGIPLLVPGERILPETLELLIKYREEGLKLEGLQDYSGETVEVAAANKFDIKNTFIV